MERQLARLVLLALVVAAGFGCGYQAGPNDPSMSAKEEAKLRENQFTPEQREARASRPK